MIVDSLMGLFSSRSIENPGVPLSQIDDDTYEALGGSRSSAGVVVNRKTALTLSAVWRGVNCVSRDVMKLPMHLYQTVGPRDRRRAKTHPGYYLLRRKPNSMMTAGVFKQTLQGHAMSAGNGFAYIYRNGDGSPRELVPLLPDRTFPARIDGKLWYQTVLGAGGDNQTWGDNLAGSQIKTLPPEDVLHIKGFSDNGILGFNVIYKAKESLGWALGMRKYSSTFFKNGARSSGVLMTPGHLDEKAAKNFLGSFDKEHAGLDNSAKTILLEEGAKYIPNTIKQDEAQFLESMEFSLLDVANWFNVAPHKVGHPGRTAYKSLQEENQRHLDEAIDPWLVIWEEECWDKLLTEEQKRSEQYYFEFKRSALIRVDFRTKVDGRAKQIQSGELSPDEARALENLGPRPDGQGHRYLMPKNMRFADEPEDGPTRNGPARKQSTPDAEARSARLLITHHELLVDAGRRVVARLANEARRAAKKPDRFFAVIQGIEADCRSVAVEMLGPAIRAATAWRDGDDQSKQGGDKDPQAATTTVVDRIFQVYHTLLLGAGGTCESKELSEAVQQALIVFEEVTPQLITDFILEDKL